MRKSLSRRRFLEGATVLGAAAALSACKKAPAVPAPSGSGGDDPFAGLANGSGAIVTVNGNKVAAYKDASGAVTQLSPKCTHQGCDVAWNGGESTWDCPCHGSRFKADGSVLSGVATEPLPKVG